MACCSAVRFIHGAPEASPAADAATVAVEVTSISRRCTARAARAAARTDVLPEPATPEINVMASCPSTIHLTAFACSALSGQPVDAANARTASVVARDSPGSVSSDRPLTYISRSRSSARSAVVETHRWPPVFMPRSREACPRVNPCSSTRPVRRARSAAGSRAPARSMTERTWARLVVDSWSHVTRETKEIHISSLQPLGSVKPPVTVPSRCSARSTSQATARLKTVRRSCSHVG